MLQITGTAQRDAWAKRELPPIEQVREYLWSVPIAFHDNPIRHTYTYLLTNRAGECIVVDPGWDSGEGRQQLRAALTLAGLTLESIVGVIATHYHSDHLGMVRYFADNTIAWVGMNQIESNALDRLPDAEAMIAEDREWLHECGVSEEASRGVLMTGGTARYVAELARATRMLAHGDRLPLAGRNLEVVLTPGHTEGHICIVDHDSEAVLTGDHVLPRISPNIGLGSPATLRDALGDYLASLKLIAQWDAYEVCPGHEYRFHGLADRAQELRDHHFERSEELVGTLTGSPGLSVWEIASKLTWSRGWESLNGMNLRGALAETGAHIEYLARLGSITLSTDQFDPRIRLVALPR
jgi:glyoxylase-like metal-dependent hydrolase (beta-lactamase superfamily II)